jgi:uncharacterized protein
MTAADRHERVSILWSKARTAARSAHLLRKSGDADGAVDRAYYAAFGAARAALARFRYAQASSKQHGTIYRRFEKLFVEERGLDPALGRRLLQKLSAARRTADYGTAATDEATATTALCEMDRFLASVEPLLEKAGA